MSHPVPELSIVICTYNRCRYLPQALASIAAQHVPAGQFELIVVDNASTDDTSAIVHDFMATHPAIPTRYVFEGNKGLSFARNRGWSEAAAAIVAYVDDDVILFDDYVRNLISFFRQNPQAMGAGGRVIPKYEDAEPAWMSPYLRGFVGAVDHGNAVKKFDDSMKYPAGANMVYRTSILRKAGGFNNELKFRSDDKYIFYKVHQLSDDIYYLPDVALYHYIDAARLAPDNFKKLFLKTGNEEKKRLRSEGKRLYAKAFEYLAKTLAGAGLWMTFTLRGQYQKGRKIWQSQWFTLKGFLMKDVFVR